jgi:hypothetical protein
MKTLLLYRPNSEHERQVIDYMRDFKMQTGKDIPTMDVDTPEGMELCRLYDIMQYPAVIVTNDDGHVQNVWVGDPMPRIGELSYYVTARSDDRTRT